MTATGPDIDWMLQECAVAERFGLPVNLDQRDLYAQMAVPLAREVRQLRRQIEQLGHTDAPHI